VSAFAGIVGQDRAAAALRSDLSRTGGSGSILLLGPEGVGRYRLARAAAVEILGGGQRGQVQVEAGTHPDFLQLEPGAGIDGVREAIAALQRRPALGPRQVLLVRDADRLVGAALNALLKTLEEPPLGAAVLVIACDAHLLPETVVSRCRVYRARPLREAEVAEVLERAGAPGELARFAEGSPGRALYRHRCGLSEPAERLADVLLHRRSDPLGVAEAIVRRRKGEERKEQRRRLEEILSETAARLRPGLPGTEEALRFVVGALGSLIANANPGLLFADLALLQWKTTPARN